MDKQRTVQRITEWRPTAVGRIGRPRLRWEEEEVRDNVSNMYNIQSEHHYVILSSIIQLVNYMFRPLYFAIIRFVLSLQRTVLRNQCISSPIRYTGM